MCPNVFPLTVCTEFVDFFLTHSWLPYVALGLLVLALVFLVGKYINTLHAKGLYMSSNIEQLEYQARKLSNQVTLLDKVRERHFMICTLPAMHKLLRAIKRGNAKSVPSDQAIAFLKTLIALWGDESFLDQVREELLKSRGDALKPGEADLYFQLTWAEDSRKGSVSFFINWKGLSTPFSWTIWL